MLVVGSLLIVVLLVLWLLSSGLWLSTPTGRQRWRALSAGAVPASRFERLQLWLSRRGSGPRVAGWLSRREGSPPLPITDWAGWPLLGAGLSLAFAAWFLLLLVVVLLSTLR